MTIQGISRIPLVLMKAKSGRVFHKTPKLLLSSSLSDGTSYGEEEFKKREDRTSRTCLTIIYKDWSVIDRSNIGCPRDQKCRIIYPNPISLFRFLKSVHSFFLSPIGKEKTFSNSHSVGKTSGLFQHSIQRPFSKSP